MCIRDRYEAYEAYLILQFMVSRMMSIPLVFPSFYHPALEDTDFFRYYKIYLFTNHNIRYLNLQFSSGIVTTNARKLLIPNFPILQFTGIFRTWPYISKWVSVFKKVVTCRPLSMSANIFTNKRLSACTTTH